MPDYRLLYFRGSRLERWESVEAPDHLAAIQEMSGRGSDRTVEIWCGDRKLAVVRPANTRWGLVDGGRGHDRN